jgi:hypothetical protein
VIWVHGLDQAANIHHTLLLLLPVGGHSLLLLLLLLAAYRFEVQTRICHPELLKLLLGRRLQVLQYNT